MTAFKKCVNPACKTQFKPLHGGHIWCNEFCYSWILREEIGINAAGMRPLGFLGEAKKIQDFNRKWKSIAKGMRPVKPVATPEETVAKVAGA